MLDDIIIQFGIKYFKLINYELVVSTKKKIFQETMEEGETAPCDDITWSRCTNGFWFRSWWGKKLRNYRVKMLDDVII